MIFHISRKQFFIFAGLSLMAIFLIWIFYVTTKTKLKYQCFNTKVDTGQSTLELVHIVSSYFCIIKGHFLNRIETA